MPIDAHEIEHVGPAVGVGDPAHDRREQHRGEVLRRVEDRRRRAALVVGNQEATIRPLAGNDGASVTPTKNRSANSTTTAVDALRPNADEALQHGEQRPEEDARGVDPLRAEAIQQPATRELREHVGPAEGREHVAHRDRVDASSLTGGARDRQRGAVGVVDRRSPGTASPRCRSACASSEWAPVSGGATSALSAGRLGSKRPARHEDCMAIASSRAPRPCRW